MSDSQIPPDESTGPRRQDLEPRNPPASSQPPLYPPGYAQPYVQPAVYVHPSAPARNGAATASLVLGIVGFCLMAIPLFFGYVFGGIPDVLAVIFGIVGITKSSYIGGVGRGAAIVGLVLGGVSLISAFFGAGLLW